MNIAAVRSPRAVGELTWPQDAKHDGHQFAKATAAGVPNWSPGPRTQSITTGMIVISAVRIDTLQTFPMSPGTQSQDTSSYKTTRAAC